MSVPNVSTSTQYISSIPPGVTEALAAMSHADLMLQNLNQILGTQQSNNALKNAKSQAESQEMKEILQGVGEIVGGAFQATAGAVNIGTSLKVGANFKGEDAVDSDLKAANELKDTLEGEQNALLQDDVLQDMEGGENKTMQADLDKQLEDVNQEINELNEKKGEFQKKQKRAEGDMARGRGISEMITAAGATTKGALTAYAAQFGKEATIAAAVVQAQNGQASHDSSRAQEFGSEKAKPWELEAEIARSQAGR